MCLDYTPHTSVGEVAAAARLDVIKFAAEPHKGAVSARYCQFLSLVQCKRKTEISVRQCHCFVCLVVLRLTKRTCFELEGFLGHVNRLLLAGSPGFHSETRPAVLTFLVLAP